MRALIYQNSRERDVLPLQIFEKGGGPILPNLFLYKRARGFKDQNA